MALNYVSLVFTEQDAGDDPGAGSVTIAPTSAVVAAGLTVVSQVPVSRSLSSGTVTVSLVATDNTDTTPAAGFWAYTITLPGGQPQTYLLPYSGGSTQQFSNLTPAVASVTYGAAAGSGGFTNPMTTLGDIMYENATPAAARLAGDTSNTRKFLRELSVAGVAQAPAWDTLQAADVPGVDGVTVTGSPSAGQVPTATGSSAATWQSPASVYQPWQFHVGDLAYGAKGNGQLVADGAMSSSSNPTHLACATSTPFGSAQAGMAVHVGGAGGGTYTPLCTTISTVTDSGHVVLAASATSTVSSGIVYFGTDDTAAIQSAVNAAVSYAQAHDGYAEVIFDPLIYIIGGAPVIGGSTHGNAQITLPVIATTAEKVTLVFRGTQDQAALNHWQQTIPQANGTVLACTRNDGTNDVSNGPAFVVGGPVNGYGGGTSVFSNVLVTVNGVGIMVPYNGTYGGWGFLGMAEATVPDTSVMAAAVPPTGSSVPSMSDDTNISGPHQFPIGLMMPDVNNNAVCDIGRYSCEGLCIGLLASEHTWFDSIHLNYCLVGIQGGSWNGVSMPHSWGGVKAVIGEGASAVVGLGAPSNMFIYCIDTESIGNNVYDPNNYLSGEIGIAYNGSPNYYSVSTINGAANLRIRDLRQVPGPVASPQAPPLTTVAWVNKYYRDAWITVALSGGHTFTSLAIDSAAQPNAAGVGIYQFLLPGGHSYTPAYSAGTLTHTVTLL